MQKKVKNYLVSVSVADLRKVPKERGFLNQGDRLQETQLLFNEGLKGYEINNGWVFAEAVEQKKYLSSGEWRGYPGWIRAEQLVEVDGFTKSDLCVVEPWIQVHEEPDDKSSSLIRISMGTRLTVCGEEKEWWWIVMPDGSRGAVKKRTCRKVGKNLVKNWREDLVMMGEKLKDAPYLWGGRSAYFPGCKTSMTSVDCSSLVELLYRIQGKQLPRDAHDQFLQCQKKDSNRLKLGDLIFLAETDKPGRVSHVMIYAGNNQFLEAEEEAQKVRLVSAKQKLGCTMENIPWGFNNGKYFIYCGTIDSKMKL